MGYRGAEGFELRVEGTNFVVCALPRREVARHLAESDKRASLVADGREDDRRPEARAVLSHAPALRDVAPRLRGEPQRAVRRVRCAILRRVEHLEVATDDLLGSIALEAFGADVPGLDASVRPEQEDGVLRNFLYEESELEVAHAGRCRGPLPVGGVANRVRELPQRVRRSALSRAPRASPTNPRRCVRAPRVQAPTCSSLAIRGVRIQHADAGIDTVVNSPRRCVLLAALPPEVAIALARHTAGPTGGARDRPAASRVVRARRRDGPRREPARVAGHRTFGARRAGLGGRGLQPVPIGTRAGPALPTAVGELSARRAPSTGCKTGTTVHRVPPLHGCAPSQFTPPRGVASPPDGGEERRSSQADAVRRREFGRWAL
jgi:hypothetical protein